MFNVTADEMIDVGVCSILHGIDNEVALTIVRHHHERYDGNWYPTGIKGDDIL